MKRTLRSHYANRTHGLKLAILAAGLLPAAALANGPAVIAGDAGSAIVHATYSGRLAADRPITIALLLPPAECGRCEGFCNTRFHAR